MTKYHGKFIVFVDAERSGDVVDGDNDTAAVRRIRETMNTQMFNEAIDYGIVSGVTEQISACESTEVRVYSVDYLLSQVRSVIRDIGKKRGIQPGANVIAAQLTEADVIAALTPPQEG